MADEESVKDACSSGIIEDLADEDGVRKLIECPICLEIPLPPIYLCAKGHIVCNSCQSRTYACPLCRERYCNTRSFVAEGIVEKCNLRCRNSENGCPVVMKGCDLVEHLKVCDYRPVTCRDCGDKAINFAEYENHLFKDHKISGTSANEAYVAYRINLNFVNRNIGLSLDTCFWPQYYIKAYDKIFLLRLNAHQYTLNPWICMLGPQSECEKYTALIEYEPTNDGQNIVHSWRGPVNHFRDEPADVICKGRALTVSMDTIMDSGAISTERAEWIYRIVITEKNPPLDSVTKEELECPTTTNNSKTEKLAVSSPPPTRISTASRKEELDGITVRSATVKADEPPGSRQCPLESGGASGGGGDREEDSVSGAMVFSRLESATSSVERSAEDLSDLASLLRPLPRKWTDFRVRQRSAVDRVGTGTSVDLLAPLGEDEDSSDWDSSY